MAAQAIPRLWRRAGTGGPVAVSCVLVGLVLAAGCAGTRPPEGIYSNLPPPQELPPGPPPDAEAPSTTPPAPGPPQADTEEPGEAPAGVYHTVRRGETLWRIGRAYGVDVGALMRANGIEDPRQVRAGARLLVPGARQALVIPPYPRDPRGARPMPPTTQMPPSSAPAPVDTGHGAFGWPVPGGEILSYYGSPRRTHRHTGLDIRGAPGDPVLAAADGRVVFAGTMRGYGKTLILDHGGGLRSLYAHNSRLLVHRGQRVRRGQAVAQVGRTGNATTEHCHFEIRVDDRPVDPLPYLAPQVGALHED